MLKLLGGPLEGLGGSTLQAKSPPKTFEKLSCYSYILRLSFVFLR